MLTPETLFLTHLAGERVNLRVEQSRRRRASGAMREVTRPRVRRSLWSLVRRSVRSLRRVPSRA